MRIVQRLALASLAAAALISTSCGGEVSVAPPVDQPIVLSLSATTLRVLQDGTPQSLEVTVRRPSGTSRPVTLSVFFVPPGVTTEIASPGTRDRGTITFTAAAQDGAAGAHTVLIRASDGASTGTAELSLDVVIVAIVATTSAQRLEMFMSTSFQPASWTDQFFIQHPDATTPLDNLGARHINLQALERDIPQRSETAWDFRDLDGIVNPIFTVTDHSPLFQIARGPDFMYDDPARRHFRDGTYQEFADYCARLVKYYNTGGFFDDGGNFHVSTSGYPITYWGIYNEPNINEISADEYVRMYNVVVPAMLAEDPTLKIVAVELSDWGDQPQIYMPTFVSGVTAPVHVVATHYYSSCNQRDTDQQLIDAVSMFEDHIRYIYSTLQFNPQLADVPVWVTENNVNADWSNGGISVCTGEPFVVDPRGSSAFFAAWRPLVFSRLGQAGSKALHHWGFIGDAQYGEVEGGTANLQLSYWVDYWLERYLGYRVDTGMGSSVLDLSVSDTTTVEILATQRDDDHAVVVMVANHAVGSPSDNNGPGEPRSVVLDTSAWGSFSSATQLTIDAGTNAAVGPTEQSVTPQPRMEITLGGYSVTFLVLRP